MDCLVSYDSWELKRNIQFLELLEYDPSARVLDVGCGDGSFSVKVRDSIGCDSIKGVDVSRENIEQARIKGVNSFYYDLNIFPYLFSDDEFDVIIANQLIEHLFYPLRFLKEIYRILKPEGYCVISTENLSSWDNIFALLFGYTPFSMEFDMGIRKLGNPFSPHNREKLESYDYPHLRIFSWHGFKDALEYAGFTVRERGGAGHIFRWIGRKLDPSHCRFITVKIKK